MAARLVEKTHLSAKGLIGKVRSVFKKLITANLTFERLQCRRKKSNSPASIKEATLREAVAKDKGWPWELEQNNNYTPRPSKKSLATVEKQKDLSSMGIPTSNESLFGAICKIE